MNVKKKKRLGRGLDALLGSGQAQIDSTGSDNTQALSNLPIEKLQRGKYQPRTNMDQSSLEDLAASIKAQGIIQPILVRPVDVDNYEIIAGERRWRAAQIAELEEVPVLIRDIPDEATLAVALIENIQRENLNPIEEAAGLKRLMDEFELTHEEMAQGIGRSRAAVTNLLRLLSLSFGAKQLLEHGKIEMGHGRALLGLPVEQQDYVAAQVYAKRLSVRQTELLVRTYNQPNKKPRKSTKSPDIERLEQTLSEKLGTRVVLQDKNGKGKLIIEYKSLDTLDGIIEHIQ